MTTASPEPGSLSTVFVAAARTRAVELGVADHVTFVHGDAAGYVSSTPVDIAACVGATWIGGGVPGTVTQLDSSVRPGGLLLVGEPFWRIDPPDQAAVEGSGAQTREAFHDLPGLVETFGQLGWGGVRAETALTDRSQRPATGCRPGGNGGLRLGHVRCAAPGQPRPATGALLHRHRRAPAFRPRGRGPAPHPAVADPADPPPGTTTRRPVVGPHPEGQPPHRGR